MTQETFNEMKDDYIQYIKDFMKDFGQFGPMITVFADSPKDEKPAIIHIPIPPQFMKNDESKDEFVEEMIPEIFADIKERFKPIAVAWAAESWIRNLSEPEHLEDYKKAPIKKEVMFVCIQEKDKNVSIVFNIKRGGPQVTPTGEIVNGAELEEDTDLSGVEGMSGRFSNLFSKFDD